MIQFLRGTSAQRANHTEVSTIGQPIFETDTKLLYIGDGTTPVKDLESINTKSFVYTTTAPITSEHLITQGELEFSPISPTSPVVQVGSLVLVTCTLDNVKVPAVVTQVSSASTATCRSVVGKDGEDGVTPLMYTLVHESTDVPTTEMSYTLQTSAFNRTPLQDESGAVVIIHVTSTNDVYYTTGYITSVSGSETSYYVGYNSGNNKAYVKISGEDGTDGKGLLNTQVPLLEPDTWTVKTWNGLTNILPNNIWTDGENIYHSNGSTHYVLDRDTSTWTSVTWNGVSNFFGSYIWVDGTDVYLATSSGNSNYVLNKETSTWSSADISGPQITPSDIFCDGNILYMSNSSFSAKLLKGQKTWESIKWITDTGSGITIDGSNVWTDGQHIYYSNGAQQYELERGTTTWKQKIWNGDVNHIVGSGVWTDGTNIYYTNLQYQYVLDKETHTWVEKDWYGYDIPTRTNIWTDGRDIYYNSGTGISYVLNRNTSSKPVLGGNYSIKKLYQHKISYNGSLVGADSGNIYVYLVIISSEANAYTLTTLNNYLRKIDSGGYYPATGVTSNTSTSYTGGVYRIGYGAMGYPIATYYVTSGGTGSMGHTSLMNGSSFHDIVTEL